MWRIVSTILMAVGMALVVMPFSLVQTTAQTPDNGTPYTWDLPPGFPLPLVPDDNPMTVEKVELGRYLFYDVRLSVNETTSCASCHHQANAFTDPAQFSTGATGEQTIRNSMTLTNVAYNATYTWAHPSLTSIEQQMLIPMFGENPIELGIVGHEAAVLSRLRIDARYQDMFGAAFPTDEDPFTFGNIIDAIASFVRTLISGNSAYDQFVYLGETDAMTESQIRGMNLFYSEKFECFHCHTGFTFSLATVSEYTTFVENAFFNTGLFNIGGTGDYPVGNRGVYEITGNPDDMGLFRTQTLRNIELTAPYMHDGSLATLEDVIEFYGNAGRTITEGEYAGDGTLHPLKSSFVIGFDATEQEIEDLINFLISLTDESFINNPAFSDPFDE